MTSTTRVKGNIISVYKNLLEVTSNNRSSFCIIDIYVNSQSTTKSVCSLTPSFSPLSIQNSFTFSTDRLYSSGLFARPLSIRSGIRDRPTPCLEPQRLVCSKGTLSVPLY